MSLLEVIQWLCHGCSCETQLVPSAGVSSRSDEPVVGSVWGGGDVGGTCCPGGIHVGAPVIILRS